MMKLSPESSLTANGRKQNALSEKLFQKMPVLHSCSLVLFILAAVIAGCTTVHKDFTPFYPAQESMDKIEAKVAIVLPDELCSLYYKPRDFQEFLLGPTVCDNARNAARAAFTEPSFFSDENLAKMSKADIIGTLRPGKVWLYGIKKIPATVIANAYLSWETRSPDGKRLYGASVRGSGADQRTFGGAGVRYHSSMQKCMDDLTKNLFNQMVSAKNRGAKNAIAAKHIREALESCQVGITTFAQYREMKDAEWHIFALQERAKHGKREYSYLIDPTSGKNVSTMGSWVTEWSTRQPVVKSLRPSVYLPESKMAPDEICDIYIKELVGPVYDNQPLGELVFEGNSMNNLVLTKRTLRDDAFTSGSYVSDEILNGALNENVQRWTKLRPGMSVSEVILTIGQPQRRTYNSGFQTWIFDYGYGVVKINNNGELSQWRLN
jgi:hypothetical protein